MIQFECLSPAGTLISHVKRKTKKLASEVLGNWPLRGKHAYSQKQDIVNQAWAWPANKERRLGCENNISQ